MDFGGIFKIIQVYERYDGAKKMQIEQHWVIPQTVPYSVQRNWKQQNLQNGKVRFCLNNNVEKEMEDSRLGAIQCLNTSFPFGENSNFAGVPHAWVNKPIKAEYSNFWLTGWATQLPFIGSLRA